MKEEQKNSHNVGIQERSWKEDIFTQDIEEPIKPTMTPKQKNTVAKWVIVIEAILAAFKIAYETLIK